jgi:hypothetical protein
MQVFTAVLLIVVFVVCLFFCVRWLSNLSPTDVAVIWYLYFLSVVVMALAVAYAINLDALALDQAGRFVGPYGPYLAWLYNAMTDVWSSTLFFGTLLVIVVLPQFLAYFAAGLTGCASVPFLTGSATKFVTWGVAKTFIVAGGIYTVVTPLFFIYGWSNLSTRLGVAAVALGMMVVAFQLIGTMRHIEKTATPTSANTLRPSGWFLRLHEKFTRRRTQ